MNQKFFGSFFQKRTASLPSSPRHLITTADDFGLSPAVNEAVEIAARDGILTSASLMVGAPHAADAVARAHALGGRLKTGLHLVVIEGPSILPPSSIPDLVDAHGQFPADQLRLGLRYAFSPRVRRQLAAEIEAQFAAFTATGLPLDHANAHKHMHLHPVVGSLMLSIGHRHGLRAIRIPNEPAMAGRPDTPAAWAMRAWTRILRRQGRRAGMRMNDQILGLADTGQMNPDVVADLLRALPDGLTELYFHPATKTDTILSQSMPRYQHAQEFQALLHTRIPDTVQLTSYSELQRSKAARHDG
jgi:hopanoid biosynthesis associated protein HpnK